MYKRYAIYYTPERAFAEKGAAWLGWDIANGCSVTHPDVAHVDVAQITQTPRKYGFHATIKPPFQLHSEKRIDALVEAIYDICKRLRPVSTDGLSVARLGGFLAFTPLGHSLELRTLAARVVEELDPFRAPATEIELQRRRQRRLTDRQEHNLMAWGYPYVMDDFQFHMTLTGRIKDPDGAILQRTHDYFKPSVPAPFRLDSLALVGEDANGMFHTVHRIALTG